MLASAAGVLSIRIPDVPHVYTWLCSVTGSSSYWCRAFDAAYLADWMMVAITLTAALAAVITLRHLAKQTELTRAAFLSTNRPKIVLRRVVPIGTPHTGQESIDARAEFANVGNTAATLIGCRTHIQLIHNGLAAKPVLGDAWEANDVGVGQDKGPAQLEAGGVWIIFMKTSPLETDDFIGFRNGTHNCWALGEIDYVDALGVRRSAGFCRVFNHATRRFELFDDPDYEYAD
jgi:hypothetical protein